jgi:hypothetical protein
MRKLNLAPGLEKFYAFQKQGLYYLIFKLFNTSFYDVTDLGLSCCNVARHTASAVHHEDEIGIRILFDHPFEKFLPMKKFSSEKMRVKNVSKH